MANWSSTEKQSNATGIRHHSPNSTPTHPLKLSPPQFTACSLRWQCLEAPRANIFYIGGTRSIKKRCLRFRSKDQHLKRIWMPCSTSASQASPHDSRQGNIHNTLLRCIGNNSSRPQWTTGFHFLSHGSSPRHACTSMHMANERCSSNCN